MTVRPSAARRSWWLREALTAEATAAPGLAEAAPPLRGSITADVVVIGGGYTGLWTALRVAELEPGARVVLLEADVCGGGPSGRNGGFVTGWWDELPSLIERHGEAGAVAACRAMDAAVDEIGAWCLAHGVDAWYTKAGSLSVSAAPAQDGRGMEAVEACRAIGEGERLVAISAEEVAARVASPVLRAGVFMSSAATIQPAVLARGLRRVALERGIVIHEGTSVVELDGERPGWLGAMGSEGRRAAPGRTGRPVRVVTSSVGGAGGARGAGRGGGAGVTRGGGGAGGPGEVIAGSAVVALNAWAAAWPSFGRRLVTWSSYIVLTEPIPERLAEIGWTGGEGLADARFTLHYLRTTRDGRIAIGGGGGRAGFGGRIGSAFTEDALSAARAAAGLRRLFPSMAGVRFEDAWGGPIDIAADHLPFIGSLAGRPVHFAHGYSGNGVGPSVVVGRLLAGSALGRVPASDDVLAPTALLEPRPRRRARAGSPRAKAFRGGAGFRGEQRDHGLGAGPRADGALPKAFPPEPFRYAGARIIREAIVRREEIEERGGRVNPILREVTRLPRRLGYHLSPD